MATKYGSSETPIRGRDAASGLLLTNKSSQNTSAHRKLSFEDDSSHQDSTSENSFSWITRDQDDELQVYPLELLQHPNICACEFVNFVTILGPARQGKSFLMNCLIGKDVFAISDTIGVCTNGVEVANAVHRMPEKRGCVFFVDTEGQGDQDVDSDATLLTPVLLLSKVIMFNWKGGLQKNQILNELAILVEVGNCVSAHSFDEGAPKFGHLHIVLRDFHFQGTADAVYNKIFEPEDKRGEKIKERNKIREKLLSSFESVNVSILPAPCDTSIEEIHDLDFLNTSEEFQENLNQLKKKILDQTKEPRYFGDTFVRPQNANFFIEKFVEELQEGDVVHLKSVVVQFQRGIVDNAKRIFEEGLLEAYRNIDVPVKDGMEGKLTRQKDALLKAFEELTAKVDVETTHLDEVLEELDEFSDREVEAKRRENLLAIKTREEEQKKVLSKAVKEFRSAVESELKRSQGGSSEKMKQDFEKQRLEEKFKESASDLDWIPELVEEEQVHLMSWASSRLNEKIEAKKNEEAYLERYKQQDQIACAAEDFRSGVESELQNNRETNSLQSFRQEFQGELERLVQAFRRSCSDDAGSISELARDELERLRRWASKKMEEKDGVLQEAQLRAQQLKVAELEKMELIRRQREQEKKKEQQLQAAAEEMELIMRQREQQHHQQQLFDSPSYPSHPMSFFDNYSSPAPSTGNSGITGLKFYKGGQFTPGGGRAPPGGCHMPPPSGGSSRSSSSRSSSSGGSKFYKGGQFLPGGGRAPKGGCRK